MSWRDLIQTGSVYVDSPWLGGRSLRLLSKEWAIRGKLPAEHGWYRFEVWPNRTSRVVSETERTALNHTVQLQSGYLIGDRVVPDELSSRAVSLRSLESCSEVVHLLEPGMDVFERVVAGRFYEDGPMVFHSRCFPMGPEQEVLDVLLGGGDSVRHVRGVTPALDLAFRLESWRRAEVERARRAEQERRELEERRRQVVERLGDGVGRREAALVDFGEAARAALAVGGAEYIDDRRSARAGEHVVRYRVDGRRLECVCDARLRIVDAGVCLTDHDTDERGDEYFTLESLPSVIRQAVRENKLVVWRHA